jgi:hypothetical protein
VRCFVWPTLYLFLAIPVAAATCAADEGSCPESEPCLKFLDDLRCFPHGTSQRDPYEERIETERHDFTQSTVTVGRGVAQVEAGYTYFYNDRNEEIEQSHTLPEVMLRLGLSDDIEFRIRWNYAWRFIDEAEDPEGGEDLRWALKLGMTDQKGPLPESALEIRFTAPTGGSAWTTERVEFGLDYIYGWEIAEGWQLAGSTGFGTNALADFGFLPEEPDSDRFIVWSQSVALGVHLTDRMTMYAEWFGLFSHALADNFATSAYNMGVDFYVTDDFVLDIRAGVGLNDDTDDFFTGIGGGYRF